MGMLGLFNRVGGRLKSFYVGQSSDPFIFIYFVLF